MMVKVAFHLLIVSLLENGVYGQCSTSPTNLAVSEGTANIIMSCSSPLNVSWTVYPTNGELLNIQITNYDDTTVHGYENLYDVSQTNLRIKVAQGNATISPGATSGLYIVQTNASSSNKNGAKLIVVREPSSCNCTAINSTSNNITCTIIYADSSYNPIYARVTWKADGVALPPAVVLNDRTRVNGYFTSTSTITTSANDTRFFECTVQFTRPMSVSLNYAATNAPTFIAKCFTSCFSISIEPTFGPIAGETTITIIISSATFENLLTYTGSNITGVSSVYIGKSLSSTSVVLLPNDRSDSKFTLAVVTPSTTAAFIGQPQLITIEFSPSPFNLTFNTAFTYLPNPEITDTNPDTFTTSGGILLDVYGHGLSSVAKPIIHLTVIMYRTAENSSTSNTSTTTASEVCTIFPGNDTFMQCPMPHLNLSDDFIKVLDSQYNTTTSRRKRSMLPSELFTASPHSLLSRLKRDGSMLSVTGSNGIDGVLSILGPNGIDRANIYLGFILDGYKKYENINDALPNTTYMFYSPPEITFTDQLIEFDPSEDDLIYVKGQYMLRGCRLTDYVVLIDNEICINSDLQDNQLSCRPPKEEPSPTMNYTTRCGQYLSIMITLGYKQYQYACLKYTTHSRRLALIIGLTVGLVGFAICLTIIIICIVRCRRKKPSQDIRQNSGGEERRHQHNVNAEGREISQDYLRQGQDYDTQLGAQQDYDDIIIGLHTGPRAMSLYKPNGQ